MKDTNKSRSRGCLRRTIEVLEHRLMFAAGNDDIAVVDCGASVDIDVLHNDFLGSSFRPVISVTEQPMLGSVSVNPDNTIAYSSQTSGSQSGTLLDEFTYGFTGMDERFVTANVSLVTKLGARALDDVVILPENTSNIDFDVRNNDIFPSGYDARRATVVMSTQPDRGTVEILPDGRLRYTADSTLFVPHSTEFSYRVIHEYGCWSDANVSVIVQRPTEIPLEVHNDRYSLVYDQANSGRMFLDVLANDVGAGLILTNQFKQSEHGYIEHAYGSGYDFVFQGAPYSGRVDFTYTVEDTYGNTAEGVVTIDIETSYGLNELWHPFFAPQHQVPMIGDFNRDNLDDIVSFSVDATQDVYVALNNEKNGFGPSTVWHDLFAQAGNEYAVGDFDGDRRDDIVRFNKTIANHHVRVSKSRGDTFGETTTWLANFDIGSGVPMTGDFNADGRDDIVVFTQEVVGGQVIVALSSGSSFNAPTVWLTEFSPAGQVPVVGDFDGDGFDDVATFTKDSRADVRVALNRTDGRFRRAEVWHTYLGPGDEIPRVIDVDFNDDRKEDIVLFPSDDLGEVTVAYSTGASFQDPLVEWEAVATRGGVPFVGNFDGDPVPDVIVFQRGVSGDVLVTRSNVSAPDDVLFENGPPDGLADSIDVEAGHSVIFYPTIEAHDPDGNVVILTDNYQTPRDGRLTRFGDLGFIYTPAPGFVGWDHFSYEVSDVYGARTREEVDILVVANSILGDVFVRIEGENAINIDVSPELLGIRTPVWGLSATQPTGGTVEVVDATHIRYVPFAGYSGLDSFQYAYDDNSDTPVVGTVFVAVEPSAPIDFNGDGNVNAVDADELIAAIASNSQELRFDLDGNMVVDLKDRDVWLEEAARYNLVVGGAFDLGDVDLNGIVDAADFAAIHSNIFDDGSAWSLGDFNADGFVDVSDFSLWNQNKFRGATARPSSQLIAASLPLRKEEARRLVPKSAETAAISKDVVFAEIAVAHRDKVRSRIRHLSWIAEAADMPKTLFGRYPAEKIQSRRN